VRIVERGVRCVTGLYVRQQKETGLHSSSSSLLPASLNFIRTLSQLASHVGEDQFERRQFSAHFVEVDLRIRVYVFIDKLGNMRRAQDLCCALLISSE
jgi:hypothetical protein